MTIKLSLAAIAAVSSVALFLGQPAHANDKNTDKPNTKQPIIVDVQAGDSLSSIAEAHGTDYVRLFNANDFISNPDLINPGDKVRVPEAEEQLPDRFSSVAAVVAAQPAAQAISGTYYVSPDDYIYASSSGNTYYPGYCTWYAKDRRPDLPNRLGNGGQWVASAAAQGYSTGSTPRAGAVAETTGHVAYVESVNKNGTIDISEMNGVSGLGVVDKRTVPASNYKYIY